MQNPLSLYIHWPFCKAKCPYCDFNSHVRGSVDHALWREALLKELAGYARLLPGREVVSIFFGGGTPSLMEPETVQALIEAAGRHWSLAREAEITLEANPTSIEAEKFADFSRAGINRVSVGIQALNDADLKFLGREHSAREALAALEIARRHFARHSFDLIYARPGQSLGDWRAELSQALALAGGHISLYQLTIEENTAFHHAHAKGAFILPDEDRSAELFELTQEMLEAHGMPAYEISNHARPGEESRHNLAYWKSDDTIGIGPGAHGRYRREGERFASENVKSPERWLELTLAGQGGQATVSRLTHREQLEEAVMMGLRLTDGIDYADWRARTGLAIDRSLDPATVARLRAQGLLAPDDASLRATPKGRLLLNNLTAKLLAP